MSISKVKILLKKIFLQQKASTRCGFSQIKIAQNCSQNIPHMRNIYNETKLLLTNPKKYSSIIEIIQGVIIIKSKIAKLREEYGLTQAQLAASVGVSRQTIISIESDKYNPSLNLAFRIAEVFDKKIEEVFIYEKD